MPQRRESPNHTAIKSQITMICKALGFETREEVQGRGWRADVLANNGTEQIAFEVQLSPQTLIRTLERQSRYIEQGIKAYWLFEKPPAKLHDERPDLPLFYVFPQANTYVVSLIDRRKSAPLSDFVKAVLYEDIRFCNVVRTKSEQEVQLNFFDMACWNCKATNHIFYVGEPYLSACNFPIEELEALWEDEKHEFRPEILQAAAQMLTTDEGKSLRVGEIKSRHSKTVGHPYRSFGCYKCDSIFGDWYVMNDTLDARNGFFDLKTFHVTVHLPEEITMSLPHWCYPENRAFCEHSVDRRTQ